MVIYIGSPPGRKGGKMSKWTLKIKQRNKMTRRFLEYEVQIGKRYKKYHTRNGKRTLAKLVLKSKDCPKIDLDGFGRLDTIF